MSRGIVFTKVMANEREQRRRRPLGLGGAIFVIIALATSAAFAALVATAAVWATAWLIVHFPSF